MKELNKKDKKDITEYIEKTINNSDEVYGFLGINNNGCAVVGNQDIILTLYTMLVKHLHKETKISRELIEQCTQLAFMGDKEIQKLILEKQKELLKAIIGEEDE